MMQRRDVLRVMAGTTAWALASRIGAAVPAKIRVTLVRWPYT
ncbi:MAG: hypothetical protein ABI565_06990 [Vicinamibacteria bacterium]